MYIAPLNRENDTTTGAARRRIRGQLTQKFLTGKKEGISLPPAPRWNEPIGVRIAKSGIDTNCTVSVCMDQVLFPEKVITGC